MELYSQILNKETYISIIGLGYVGMPIAVAFAKKINVIGFDVNKDKIAMYKRGIDSTKEVGDKELQKTKIKFTNDSAMLQKAKFHIIAVPTPVNNDRTPDLKYLESACEILGRNLVKDSIIVFESTVFPGATEDICLPILEKISGMKCGIDFKIGYSPERINPGDSFHRLENITKVVSGMDNETLNIIAEIYSLVVQAGVYRAESIKVAEAAKVIENSQRDINIAFMNELSIIFDKMGIDTQEVLNAAKTKWNFIDFSPGIVGGHCIGVDPYYLTYKAEELGYQSQIILSGRKINDSMGKYIAEKTIKQMIRANKRIKGAKIALFGVTFKENCPDFRNSKVFDIIKELQEYEVKIQIIDPIVDKLELIESYGISICKIEQIEGVDATIFAVAHDEFINLTLRNLRKMYTNKQCVSKKYTNEKNEDKVKESYVLVDVKGIFDKKLLENNNFLYWRL